MPSGIGQDASERVCYSWRGGWRGEGGGGIALYELVKPSAFKQIVIRNWQFPTSCSY